MPQKVEIQVKRPERVLSPEEEKERAGKEAERVRATFSKAGTQARAKLAMLHHLGGGRDVEGGAAGAEGKAETAPEAATMNDLLVATSAEGVTDELLMEEVLWDEQQHAVLAEERGSSAKAGGHEEL